MINAADLLKLFSEPGGKWQSKAMQQLGQLHIVFPVVPGQVRMCLRGKRSRTQDGKGRKTRTKCPRIKCKGI